MRCLFHFIVSTSLFLVATAFSYPGFNMNYFVVQSPRRHQTSSPPPPALRHHEVCFVAPRSLPRLSFISRPFSSSLYGTPAAGLSQAGAPASSDGGARSLSIKPNAVARLEELKFKQSRKDKTPFEETKLTLRLAVKSGGCSGLSYDIDFIAESDVSENDVVETYDDLLPGLTCVIDNKSLLYLFGLSLDYSDALVGGGFQFNNPNASANCGCGKSFGV